jgi:hypothetical protein
MTTQAIFGKPETGGVLFVDPQLMEHATLVYRAIHTLEVLRDWNKLGKKDDIPALFAEQSWCELRRLLDWYEVQGVRIKDIDIGEYV